MTINQRCCISCRRLADKSDFWRVVRLNNREISINNGMGRSAYICQTEKCLLVAEKKDRFSRALKTAVPKDLYQTLKKTLLAQPPGISPSASNGCRSPMS